MYFSKKIFFSTNVVFSADMAGNFGNFCCQGRKRTPWNFTIWALNQPFLGKKGAVFFSRTLFDPFYHQKNFWGQGTFFDVFRRVSHKKISNFVKKKTHRIHSLKWPWIFQKCHFSFLCIFVKNGFWKKICPKLGLLASKLSTPLIFFDQVGFFGRFLETWKLAIFQKNLIGYFRLWIL